MIDKFVENSFYPTLEQPLELEGTEFQNQEIYKLNRPNEIIKDVKKEKRYESVFKKYKKLHKSL